MSTPQNTAYAAPMEEAADRDQLVERAGEAGGLHRRGLARHSWALRVAGHADLGQLVPFARATPQHGELETWPFGT